MKRILYTLIILSSTLFAQKIKTVKLSFNKAKDVTWKGCEHHYFSKNWKSDVITNVSRPTIDIYEPAEIKKNGTTVIIAPGGGLFALSMNNEGTKVAKWLNKKGITAVILKYRLVPTGKDGISEYRELNKNGSKELQDKVTKVIPYSIQDGLSAISYMRENAKKYNINPNKIGFMGFSAGGAVAMGVSYNYTQKSRPNFLVPVYPWTAKYPVQQPQKDAPPIIIFCASNDPLKLALGSIDLYTSWKKNNLSAELHMYATGGHGFGLNTRNLQSDTWIDRFYDWAISEKFITLKNKIQ